MVDKSVPEQRTVEMEDVLRKYILEYREVHVDELVDERSSFELLEEYGELAKRLNALSKEIVIYSLVEKHEKQALMKSYEEEGVKAIKTREQLVKDDFYEYDIKLAHLKEVRDNMTVDVELLQYVLEYELKRQ